ncbi:molybdopterin-guanine dinucleotide biosynthesis protein B [Pigmentiphaga soli]|uniref:Molybdopterin-guanine dinucleotide biosynthesis protein B n=1 Tax=Pigmentiphaga soli TaxID=1007095 RepID=A0ABP8H8B7_9BURK
MKVFGFAGYSGAGKTTLIERLIPCFVARGLRVSLIKHAHERFDLDRPGKDSYRHREAGATEVLLSSPHRWALLHENRGQPEPGMREQLARLSPCDLVLVEGYKGWPIPKLEVWRPATGKPRWEGAEAPAVAVATDRPDAVGAGLPVLDLNDPVGIAGWILDYLDGELK